MEAAFLVARNDRVDALRRLLVPPEDAETTLADGQTVTGKLVELPKVNLGFEANQPPAIPFDQIVQLEVAVPGLSRRGVLGVSF